MKPIHRRQLVALVAALLVGLATDHALAEVQRVDRRMGYQGQIRGSSGPTTIAFRIVDAEGAQVWGPEAHIVTPDADGTFYTVVGSTGLDADDDEIPDLDALDFEGLELEVSVDDGTGQLVAMSERQALVPAFHASTASSVSDGAISGEMIAADAVTTEKLADASITSADFAGGTLDGSQLATGALTGAQIADGAITGANFQSGSIGFADLGNDSVLASHLAPGSVGGWEIQDGTITGTEVSAGVRFAAKTCRWSGYANAGYDDFTVECTGDGEVMVGLYSISIPDDRRFQILCCTLGP